MQRTARQSGRQRSDMVVVVPSQQLRRLIEEVSVGVRAAVFGAAVFATAGQVVELRQDLSPHHFSAKTGM